MMPIPLSCECGRSFRVKDQLAGKKIRCPDCSGVLSVPALDAEEEATALLLTDEPPKVVAPRPRYEDEPTELDAIQQRPSPQPSRPRPAQAPARPKVRREKPRGGPRIAFEQGWFGSVNSGVVGGLLMMVIAVIWFFAALLLFDRIFYYPPVLLVVGFISMVKGLAGGK